MLDRMIDGPLDLILDGMIDGTFDLMLDGMLGVGFKVTLDGKSDRTFNRILDGKFDQTFDQMLKQNVRSNTGSNVCSHRNNVALVKFPFRLFCFCCYHLLP